MSKEKRNLNLILPLKTLNLYNSYGQFIQNMAFKTNDTLIVLQEFWYEFNSPSFWFPSGIMGDVRFLNCHTYHSALFSRLYSSTIFIIGLYD